MAPTTLLIPFTGQVPREWLNRSAGAWVQGGVQQVIVVGPKAESLRPPSMELGWRVRSADTPFADSIWRGIIEQLSTPTLLTINGDAGVSIGPDAIRRLTSLTEEAHASLVYCNYVEETADGQADHPTNPYQLGSIRDNFDFGPVMVFGTQAIRAATTRFGPLRPSQYGSLYDLRLRVSAISLPLQLPETLYRAHKLDNRPTGQQQFDYVDQRHRCFQEEMEQIVTDHLQRIGAYMAPRFTPVQTKAAGFPVEASVIIPVRNRVKTVADAARSALSQEAPFAFNVIVVDNHSNDGTTDVLRQLAGQDSRLVHIVPERHDLGIGGCWNLAVAAPPCGRVCVQLDSDDLYSSPATLRQMVEKVHEGPFVMVVGSYRMVNFDLHDIPPGLIDHREWTRENGRNNLLRVNGLGAPRAFLTEMLRQYPLPNVSYGEDYAVGLRLSRHYEIGRIFEPLYLCRRWEGNTDANLAIEVKNRHDAYKDRVRTLEIMARQQVNLNGGSPESMIEQRVVSFPGALPQQMAALWARQSVEWPRLVHGVEALRHAGIREFDHHGARLLAQCNPARIVSASARVDAAAIAARPCFLCPANLPVEQLALVYRQDWLILSNPAPIFEPHFTITLIAHQPQRIAPAIETVLDLAGDVPDAYTLLYNGPKCGASAPDHLHLQAAPIGSMPVERELMAEFEGRGTGPRGWVRWLRSDPVRVGVSIPRRRPLIVLIGQDRPPLLTAFERILRILDRVHPASPEAMLNLLAWHRRGEWALCIFPRALHRPAGYGSGAGQFLISPGAADVGGILITPRREDLERLTSETAGGILDEVLLSPEAFAQVSAELGSI